MKFVEEYSDRRIVLPDFPDIPENKLDEYLSEQVSNDIFNEDKFLAKDEV